MPQMNKKPRYLSEILADANKATDPVQSLREAIVEEVRLVSIIGYAINPKFKIANVLPPGEPPFTHSDLPLGLAELDILKLHNKLYILFNPSVKQYKREEFFIRWLESMHPTDVEILIAIKDQKLDALYDKLTPKVIHTALGWTDEQYKSLFT